MSRLCQGGWLRSLASLVRNTEAPDQFWFWSGLFTICAALERKVYIPYGLNKIWPNLYVILVSPPGRCRKGGPIGLSKMLLDACKITISVDSTSKESLTQEIAASPKQISYENVVETQSPMSIIVGEFSDLVAVDVKKMIEFLTSIYDYTGDTWEYKTKHGGKDKLYGPCVSLFTATTPTWLAENIPYQAFGAGFFSRVNFVVGINKKKRVPRPTLTSEDEEILKRLLHDLNTISHLRGAFSWEDEAGEIFDNWYNALDKKYNEVPDERFHGFIERCHVQVLKIAMALRVSYSDELILTADDVGRAIDLVEAIFPDLPRAFGGMGRSRSSVDIYTIMEQIAASKTVAFSELLRTHWTNIEQEDLMRAIETLRKMGAVKIGVIRGDDFTIEWVGIKEKGDGK